MKNQKTRSSKRSIKMFIGCCKHEGEAPLSVAQMDQAIDELMINERLKDEGKAIEVSLDNL